MNDPFDSADWTIPSKQLAEQLGLDIKLVYKERARRKITKLKLRRIPDDQQPEDHKLIKCKYGEIAKVSNEDFENVVAHCWCVRHGKRYGYARACINRVVVWMHHFIMGKQMLDHINGDKLDNRRENLRPATQQQNSQNRKKWVKGTSTYKGVSFDKTLEIRKKKSLWRAQIGRKCIGYFKTPEEAARAYDGRAREIFGKFAVLNFPDHEK